MNTPCLGVAPSFGVIPFSDRDRERGIQLQKDDEDILLQQLLLKTAGAANLDQAADDVEEVKRELNEAIEKEMEIPSIMIPLEADDNREFFDQHSNKVSTKTSQDPSKTTQKAQSLLNQQTGKSKKKKANKKP